MEKIEKILETGAQMESGEVIHYSDGYLFGLIAEEDTCVGFLLAGIGECKQIGEENFLPVTEKTTTQEILSFFQKLQNRNDIAIILIEKHISTRIQQALKFFKKSLPIILEIPSKGHPFIVEDDNFISKAYKLSGDHV